ncbi:hypothetical protein FB451DRAFT_1182961 [Mycena latifolia]|nr:hypothetical protein FB451DRAFT_1182961 [Mycena latifolia]
MYYRRLCCASSSAGEILQSHNPDVLSVASGSQLVSLVVQDWAVRVTLVKYVSRIYYSAYTYSFRGLSTSACEVPNLEDAEWEKKAENGLYRPGHIWAARGSMEHMSSRNEQTMADHGRSEQADQGIRDIDYWA